MSAKLIVELQPVGLPWKEPTRFDIVFKFDKGGFERSFNDLSIARKYCEDFNSMLKELNKKYE